MKILHVTNHFYPCIGGVERHVQDLSEQLIRRGHISDVLCLNRCSSGQRLPSRGTWGKVSIFRVPFIELKYYKVAGNVLDYVKKYDVVHVHGLGYFFDFLSSTRQIHKKKIILSTHGGFFHTKNLHTLKEVHFKTLTKWLLKNADKVVAVSRQDQEMFSRIADVEYIPNGIDSKKFFSGKKQKKSFIYVGRIAKNKRVDNLIRAFSIVAKNDPQAKLLVIGSGGDILPSLEEWVRKQGLQRSIVFAGQVTESEKRKYLSSSQFFLSASEYEGFGIAVVEAMASGCIPIVNSIPAFSEVVGKNGFLVDFNDPQAAATRIQQVIRENPRTMQKNAMMEAKKNDWEIVMKKWEKVYAEK